MARNFPMDKFGSDNDDEDDLEALRLAALKTLKKPQNGSSVVQGSPNKQRVFSGRGGGGASSRGRFFGHFNSRNGQFNQRRNDNLISITPIEQASPIEKPENSTSNSSKFERFNDSDNSDSDSEGEQARKSSQQKQEDCSPSKLERSNSLEALMAQLDEEIEGKTKPKEKTPQKDIKKKEKSPSPPPPPKRLATPPRRKSPVSQRPRPLLETPVFPFIGASPKVIPPLIPKREFEPLFVNTNTNLTATLAPLSPRSAAFVLENRAIVEKRKREKSYSRSPSPVIRRRRSSVSPSPRRSLSPIRRRRKSLSPVTRKKPLRQRLGVKPQEKPKSPEKEKVLEEDAVLAARRKKFESKELNVKEGVIRLKPETSSNEEPKEEEDDFEELDLDIKFDEIFSDEESDSENEGRFKTKSNLEEKKVPALSFSKLVNGVKPTIKVEALPDDLDGKNRKFEQRRRRPERPKRLRKSPSPVKVEIKKRKSPKKIEVKTVSKPEKIEAELEIVEDSEEEVKVEPQQQSEEGDLRAQLSKKRAARTKLPGPLNPGGRLLQTALKGAVFTATEKKRKNEITEIKVPIHQRLGKSSTTGDVPAAEEELGRKKRRKKDEPSSRSRKTASRSAQIKARLEQV